MDAVSIGFSSLPELSLLSDKELPIEFDRGGFASNLDFPECGKHANLDYSLVDIHQLTMNKIYPFDFFPFANKFEALLGSLTVRLRSFCFFSTGGNLARYFSSLALYSLLRRSASSSNTLRFSSDSLRHFSPKTKLNSSNDNRGCFSRIFPRTLLQNKM
uniref:Uncharacterized protein n=1 Tax=Romanomermis culicivorax TaxID=13658 RepID=A0A915KD54_ROMCU